jgi:hypothetical protein
MDIYNDRTAAAINHTLQISFAVDVLSNDKALRQKTKGMYHKLAGAKAGPARSNDPKLNNT